MLTHFCLLRAAVILQSQNSKTFLGSMSRNTFSLLFILEYRRANSPREDTLKTVVVFFFMVALHTCFFFPWSISSNISLYVKLHRKTYGSIKWIIYPLSKAHHHIQYFQNFQDYVYISFVIKFKLWLPLSLK